VFIIGSTTDAIYSYDLSSGFDINKAFFSGTSYVVAAQDTSPFSLEFNSDGTMMFMMGSDTNAIYFYDLSIGFDIATASYSGTSFSVAAQDSLPLSLEFNSDGTMMFMLGTATKTIYFYNLSTGFDIMTASYLGTSIAVGAQDSSPLSLEFNSVDTKMFMMGANTNTIYSYDINSVSSPQYRICSDAICNFILYDWRSDGTGQVNNMDYVQIQLISPNAATTTSTAPP